MQFIIWDPVDPLSSEMLTHGGSSMPPYADKTFLVSVNSVYGPATRQTELSKKLSAGEDFSFKVCRQTCDKRKSQISNNLNGSLATVIQRHEFWPTNDRHVEKNLRRFLKRSTKKNCKKAACAAFYPSLKFPGRLLLFPGLLLAAGFLCGFLFAAGLFLGCLLGRFFLSGFFLRSFFLGGGFLLGSFFLAASTTASAALARRRRCAHWGWSFSAH